MEKIKAEIRKNPSHYLTLFMLLAVGFGLRLYYFFASGVENDEIFSWSVYGSRPLWFSLSRYDTNNHPLNSLLSHISTRIFGHSIQAVRIT